MMKHVNFQVYRTNPDGVFRKNQQITTKFDF